MNRVIREQYGDRVWGIIVDKLVREEYKYANGQIREVREYFTKEPMYWTRHGFAEEFAGPEDLYKTEVEADSVAMLLVMAYPQYMGHIEVVKFQ